MILNICAHQKEMKMSKVTNINKHKDFDPIYRGVAYKIRDKQALLNKSILDLCDYAFDVHVKGATNYDQERAMIESWFNKE